MPYSYQKFKNEVKDHLLEVVKHDHLILDVGPGCGTYGIMLKGQRVVDAVEIYAPYISRFNLHDIYNEVHNVNILDFNINPYDYIIMGDILEHLNVRDAIGLIDKINSKGAKCLVAVPYLYEQGESEGNVHETHLQPDLTPAKMKTRYPSLRLLYGDDDYGYYVNY